MSNITCASGFAMGVQNGNIDLSNQTVVRCEQANQSSANLTVISSEQANQSLSKEELKAKEYMERQYSIWHLEERYDDLKSKRRYDFTEKDEQDFEYTERALGDTYYLDYQQELYENYEDDYDNEDN